MFKKESVIFNYEDMYKQWEAAGKPDWTGGPPPKEGNLQYNYTTVHHTCGVDSTWYPGLFLGNHEGQTYIPNQPPKQSENMVLVDTVESRLYVGDQERYDYYKNRPYPQNGTKEEKEEWSKYRDIQSKEFNNKVIDALNKEPDTNQPNLNLTYHEQVILLHSRAAWDYFISLSNKSEDDIIEFKDAIHRLQQIIALRVARRVDTAVWLQPNGKA